MFSTILLVFAFVLFAIAALAYPVDPWRGRLISFGLACWVAAELARGLPGMVR